MVGELVIHEAVAQMGPPMNDGPRFDPLTINVASPVENQVYNNSDFIQLFFTITKPAVWFTSGGEWPYYDCQGKVEFVRYSVDGIEHYNSCK
jgi:hypothetical protein